MKQQGWPELSSALLGCLGQHQDPGTTGPVLLQGWDGCCPRAALVSVDFCCWMCDLGLGWAARERGAELGLPVPRLSAEAGAPHPAVARSAQRGTSQVGFSVFCWFFFKEKKIYFFPSAPPSSSQRVCEMALCNGQFQKWKFSSCEFQPRQMFWRETEARILQSHLRGPVRTCSRTC